MNKAKKRYLWLMVAFIIGAALTAASIWLISLGSEEKSLEAYPYRENTGEYRFINPLLFYETPKSKEFGEYTKLEEHLEDFIKNNSAKNTVKRVSVYFRDLKRGRWVGINEDETFKPHSLLKTAFMLAYLKKTESEPLLMEKKFLYSSELKESISKIPFENNSNLEENRYYSVEYLIKKMIIESDNVAKDILTTNIDKNAVNDVFTDLGMQLPVNNEEPKMSTKLYASFFRILFNATYVNRNLSEWALKILSDAEFEKGIRASVPKSIPVAHKFGIEAKSLEAEGQELHDCGIVYYPKIPYLLCIMTEGQNISGLVDFVGGISNLVYKEISNL